MRVNGTLARKGGREGCSVDETPALSVSCGSLYFF